MEEEILKAIKENPIIVNELIKKGMVIGCEHAKMSPETAENLNRLTGVINEIKISIAELPEKIIEKCENKFASKATEKIVYTMIAIICIGVLTALLSNVVKAVN